MLFNSHVFLLAFLPTFLFAVWAAQRRGGASALHFGIAFSLFFYAWWDVRFLPLILFSMGVNYAIGKRLALQPRTWLLSFGIAVNLAVLGWFKYYNFFVINLRLIGIDELPFLAIVLPLGISFFTFQQISFLVDVYRGGERPRSLVEYAFFVSFFPQLIAGPIVRWSEMAPQLAAWRPRITSAELAPGLTLFAIGLGKKVLFADSVAVYATPVFDMAATGAAVAPLLAWQAALAYAMQIYFDFSGYSDMAIGLALMVGIHLPINFASPYRAASIIEFWRRWHMTLSRFLRDYLYIPLGGRRGGSFRQSGNLLVVMLLGGLWHGAGFTFVLWGLMHGLMLLVNHVFRHIAGDRVPISGLSGTVWRAGGWALTFLAVTSAWVVFRAADLDAALVLLGAMAGIVPEAADSGAAPADLVGWLLVGALLAVSLLAPSSHRIVGIASSVPLSERLVPVDELDRSPLAGGVRGRGPEPRTTQRKLWQPSLGWAAATGVLFAAVLASLHAPSEFLYFAF